MVSRTAARAVYKSQTGVIKSGYPPEKMESTTKLFQTAGEEMEMIKEELDMQFEKFEKIQRKIDTQRSLLYRNGRILTGMRKALAKKQMVLLVVVLSLCVVSVWIIWRGGEVKGLYGDLVERVEKIAHWAKPDVVAKGSLGV